MEDREGGEKGTEGNSARTFFLATCETYAAVEIAIVPAKMGDLANLIGNGSVFSKVGSCRKKASCDGKTSRGEPLRASAPLGDDRAKVRPAATVPIALLALSRSPMLTSSAECAVRRARLETHVGVLDSWPSRAHCG